MNLNGKADVQEKKKLSLLYKIKDKKAQNYEQMKRSILLLLKFDAKNLLDRINNRKIEYMNEFSLKRTREHFKEIFANRYQSCSINILKHCDVDVLSALNNYHTKVEEVLWYLNHTQDMSKTAEDKITIYVTALRKLYATLELYLDAAIEVQDKLIEDFNNKEKNKSKGDGKEKIENKNDRDNIESFTGFTDNFESNVDIFAHTDILSIEKEKESEINISDKNIKTNKRLDLTNSDINFDIPTEFDFDYENTTDNGDNVKKLQTDEFNILHINQNQEGPGNYEKHNNQNQAYELDNINISDLLDDLPPVLTNDIENDNGEKNDKKNSNEDDRKEDKKDTKPIKK
ncbi:MAG: hypothetical protein HQK51_13260 [Oligoflexia bacterium]|nr:hypothetical protein [Oligoflexia bacterium]